MKNILEIKCSSWETTSTWGGCQIISTPNSSSNRGGCGTTPTKFVPFGPPLVVPPKVVHVVVS